MREYQQKFELEQVKLIKYTLSTNLNNSIKTDIAH